MMQQILLYTIPVVVLVLGVWLIQYTMYRNEAKKQQYELKRESQKAISPIRMRAYERLSLLLERTEPEALLMDLKNKDSQALTTWSVSQVQQYLLQEVRAEFDHNMSQQIYVSDELWQRIMLARDEMGAFITQMAMRLPKGSDALQYTKTLITAYHTNGDTPHELALNALKDEARSLL